MNTANAAGTDPFGTMIDIDDTITTPAQPAVPGIEATKTVSGATALNTDREQHGHVFGHGLWQPDRRHRWRSVAGCDRGMDVDGNPYSDASGHRPRRS